MHLQYNERVDILNFNDTILRQIDLLILIIKEFNLELINFKIIKRSASSFKIKCVNYLTVSIYESIVF